MDQNSREVELSRLSVLLSAIKSGLFRLISQGPPISVAYPSAIADVNQVALIMRNFEKLPAEKYPHINGILDGKELPEDMDLVFAELKGVFTDASRLIAGGH